MSAELKYSINQLKCLLDEPKLLEEMRAYRCTYTRLKTRLRNNQFVAKLKHLNTMNRRLKSKNPVNFKTESFMLEFVEYIDQLLDKTLHVFVSVQPYLRVGHLVHHLIMIKTTIARLRIYYKAMLVYACDIITSLPNTSSQEKALLLLEKQGCKPRAKKPQEENKIEEFNSGSEVGLLIDRDTRKPAAVSSKH